MKDVHIFISHSWTYRNHHDGLVALLRNTPKFRIRDYSVPKDDPIHTNGTDIDLENAIWDQMRSCSVVLVLAGLYANYSKWIDKEIRMAQKGFSTPKPIVAIEPWGSERTSTVVKDAADRIVKWNTNSIVDAIEGLV